MKKFAIVMCFLIFSVQLGGSEVSAIYYGEVGPPGPNEIHIGKTIIVMPLRTVILVRRGSEHCAVRFTEFWTGETEEDLYARYESYYQGTGLEDFASKEVQSTKEKLSFPKPRGIGRFAFSFGNKEIKCGPIRLFWSGEGSVQFYGEGQKEGDYGIELAPTPWSDITHVNVRDSRIRWYRYDANRKRVNIPVNRIWNNE